MSEIKHSLKCSNLEVSEVFVQASVTNTTIKSTGATTITNADNSNRVLLVPDTTGVVTINLQQPSVAGIKYNIIYGGANVSGNAIHIQTASVSNSINGIINHISTDTDASVAVRNSALANNKITIAASAESFMLELTSLSNNKFVVTGNVVGPTDTAFSTQS